MERPVNLRLRRGYMLLEKLTDTGMSSGKHGTAVHLATGPRTFHYEAFCMLHEPLHGGIEDLTGCHLIVDPLGGRPFRIAGTDVVLLHENGALAIYEKEDV